MINMKLVVQYLFHLIYMMNINVFKIIVMLQLLVCQLILEQVH